MKGGLRFSMVHARQYKPTTIRRLDSLAGNQCAAPKCTSKLIAKDGESLISKICHIEAASKNGPRWNPNMSDDELRDFENLILLCDECHIIIDNMAHEAKYPVRLLKQWKKDHNSTRTYERLNASPSLLNMVIAALADTEFDIEEAVTPSTLKAFEIDDKLSYNDIKRNRPLIDEYKAFYTKVNSLYQTLEREGSFKKEHLLRNIRGVYLHVKGKYVEGSDDCMDLIRKHSDDIIDDVLEILINKSEEKYSSFSEDITFGVPLIMVDAFMRCKILEEPVV